MEETVSRIKQFIKEFDNGKLSPSAEENVNSTVVGNYSIKPEDVFGEVIYWVLNYLEQRKCPYELAVFVAKNVAKQLSTLTSDKLVLGNEDDTENGQNASDLYGETVSYVHSMCSSFTDQPDQTEAIASSVSIPHAASVFAIKNKRRKMEDRHVIHHDLNAILDLQHTPPHSYYAVFDGHAGADAASYAAAHLHINIVNHPAFLTDTVKAIKEAYQKTDESLLDIAKREGIKSGCTAVSALIRDNTVYLTWLGDSQALLVKQGKPLIIMAPHKPDREDEKKRIIDLGGHVYHYGTWRVNGNLAVSRALGDPDHKPFIISEPDINVIQLDGTEDFLILACDGLWDEMSPEDVSAALYQYLFDNALGDMDEMLQVAAKLVHQSKLQGSDDNITTIVVFLRDISSIIADCLNISTSVPLVDIEKQNLQLITDSIENEKDSHNVSITKPSILELNGASSKKLKKGPNVMDLPYSTQLVDQDAPFFSFQPTSSNPMSCNTVNNDSLFSNHNTSLGYPPEATALSELPTPPIDDMLASQQFEQFCATELYQGLDLVTSDPKCSSFKIEDQKFSGQVFSQSCISVDSYGKCLDDLMMTQMQTDFCETLKEQTPTNADVCKSIMPDEAIGIASTVVSNAIETAVKCVSSNEHDPPMSPVQSTQKLNPYAEPFVMKSYISQEDPIIENKAVDCIGDPVSLTEQLVCDINCLTLETVPLNVTGQINELENTTNYATIPKTEDENVVESGLLKCEIAASALLNDILTLQSFSKSEPTEINVSNEAKYSDEICNPQVPAVLTEMEIMSDDSLKHELVLQPNFSVNQDLLEENVVHHETFQDLTAKNDVVTSSENQSENCINAAIKNDVNTSSGNQSENSVCAATDISNTSTSTECNPVILSDSIMPQEGGVTTSDIPLQNSIIEDTSEFSEMPVSEQVVSKDSLILKEVEEKFKTTGDTIPSEHVEDPHTNVDLQSVPAGIPEAEGVTEDIDSDSEKDGGWSYMKGNTVSNGKNANDVKSVPDAKNKKTVEKKSFLQNVKKPTLDSRVKVKGTVPAEKSKKLLLDKKPCDTKEIKDKTKTAKSSVTLPSMLKSNTSEKLTKTTITRVKKESTVTNTKVSTTTVPNKMARSTLQRNPVVVTKAVNSLNSGANARPKPVLPLTETKTTTRTGSSTTVTKELTSNQGNKTNVSSLARSIPSRPTSSNVTLKAVPLFRSTPLPSKANSVDLKTKPTVSVTKKTISSIVKKPDVKEAKNSVNKQISAGKVNPLTSHTKGELATSAPKTSLSSRRVIPSNDKSLVSRAASNPAAKKEVSKKDIPKKPIRGIASSKLSKEEVKSKSIKTAPLSNESVKGNTELGAVEKSNVENPCEVLNASEEEKFILETNIKETIPEEKKNISSAENNELCALAHDPLSKKPEPVNDVTSEVPVTECTSPKIV